MAIPSEYEHVQSLGATNIKHPIITFRVIMNRRAQETIGPLTNARTGDVLHPEMHQTSPDDGRTMAAQTEASFKPFIPGFLRGSNITLNDDDTFTAYGQQAVYLKTQYADIANPLLEVTNDAPYTSA